MFQVVIQPQLQMDLITPDCYDIEKINEFIPHTTGNSVPEDFNLKYHLDSNLLNKLKRKRALLKSRKKRWHMLKIQSQKIMC